MDETAQSPLVSELEAAFAWWNEAGVDCCFGDEPVNWLARKPSQTESQPPPQRPEVGPSTARAAPSPPPELVVERASLPANLGAFTQWWLTEPTLDAGRTSDRVAPRGGREAELMVLVAEPESGDRDVLLSGPQGKFLENMLRAMGFAAGEVYFASALPRHLPGADWRALAASGIGEVLHHHIALAAPRRLVAFGGNILPLLGNNLPQNPAGLREISLEERSIPVLCARDIAGLLGRPRWKAELWRSWLGWEGPPGKQ